MASPGGSVGVPRRPVAAGAPALAVALAAMAAACLPSACSFSPDIQSGKLACSPKGECPRGFSCAPSGAYANRCVTEGTPISPTGGGGGPAGFGGRSGGTAGSSGFPDGGIGHDAAADLHFEAPPPDIGVPGTGGAIGTGGAGGGGLPGIGGSGVPPVSTAPFLGTWVFDAGSYIELDCGSGTTPTQYAIDRSTVSIYASPSGAAYAGASWSFWSACTYQLYLGSDGGLHLFDTNWQCSDTSQDPTYVWFGYDFDVFLSGATGRAATHYGSYILGSYYADGSTYYCDQYVSGTLTKL